MGKHADRAEELFLSGYNCAQAVFGAFADELGVDMRTAMRIASSFGGGMGQTGQLCGAELGMALAIGMMHGFEEASDTEGKRKQSERTKRLIEEFRAEFGGTGCAELYEIGNRENCARFVRFAAEQVKQESFRR